MHVKVAFANKSWHLKLTSLRVCSAVGENDPAIETKSAQKCREEYRHSKSRVGELEHQPPFLSGFRKLHNARDCRASVHNVSRDGRARRREKRVAKEAPVFRTRSQIAINVAKLCTSQTLPSLEVEMAVLGADDETQRSLSWTQRI